MQPKDQKVSFHVPCASALHTLSKDAFSAYEAHSLLICFLKQKILLRSMTTHACVVLVESTEGQGILLFFQLVLKRVSSTAKREADLHA